MPIYDYDCPACGRFSARRSLADFAAPTSCPSCGVPAPRLLLSTPQLGGGQRAEAGAPAAARVSHGGGCACCGVSRPGRLRAESV